MGELKVLESFYSPNEIRFPRAVIGGRELPEVIVPKRRYSNVEAANGKRNVIQLDEDHVARLEADEIFRSMIEHGTLRWLDKFPGELRNKDDIIAEQAAEIASLKKAAGIEEPPAPVNKPVPVTNFRREELEGMTFKNLINLAVERGLAGTYRSKKDAVDAIAALSDPDDEASTPIEGVPEDDDPRSTVEAEKPERDPEDIV